MSEMDHPFDGCMFCRTYDNPAEAGSAAALKASSEVWQSKSLNWIQSQGSGTQITADDLVKYVGKPDSGSSNAIGAIFRKASSNGLLKMVGYANSDRVTNHGRVLRVWQVL